MKRPTKPQSATTTALAAPTLALIYVTRDIERALGKEPTGDYFIITNRSVYAEKIAAQYPDNVWLVDDEKDGEEKLDTFEILSLPEVREQINKATKEKNAQIIVFKNTPRIESIVKENGWHLLNPSATLAEKIENKITQVEWLGDLGRFLPKHEIKKVADIGWNAPTFGKTFIVQWAHSHTGDGTLLITSEAQLNELQQKFPNREARVSEFLKGPSFTVNVVENQIGNISYQITGALPFTENPWTTVGNDWSLTHTILNERHIVEIETIAKKVSEKMMASGWCGLFGIDVMYDEERDQIYLIEINARQPASTTYESELQQKIRKAGVVGQTIFEAHIASLREDTKAVTDKIIPINDGAQIVQRITSKIVIGENISDKDTAIKKIESTGYTCIPYEQNMMKLNSDFLRIQSGRGILAAHNKFNSRGKEIIELVTTT